MNKQEAIKELESYKMIGTDARSACYNEAIKAGILVIKKLDEPQKPVVPKFVAEYLNYCIGNEWTLAEGLNTDNVPIPSNIAKTVDWLFSSMNQNIFAQAWLYGYEVEKEPLYYVKIPSLAYDMFLVKGEDGELIVFQNTSCGTKFTEAEIKAIDERYWAFAVPVEEVAEG